MKKFYFLAAGLLCLSSLSFAQNKRTVLSATIDGYKRDMVYLIVCRVRLYVRSFTPIPARNTSIRLIPTDWSR